MNLEVLRGGLVVSVQAAKESPLDDPKIIAALARAAVDGGAAGVRIAGTQNLRAVRAAVNVPIIGIIKREYPGYEPYITPTMREATEVLACGAEIVAFDATWRPHPDEGKSGNLESAVRSIHDSGGVAMADCATLKEGRAAKDAGCDILATTLCGYTNETRGNRLPALELVAAFRSLGAFVICEGGVHSPEQAAAARKAGADCVVVGTAITNISWLVSTYVAALRSS